LTVPTERRARRDAGEGAKSAIFLVNARSEVPLQIWGFGKRPSRLRFPWAHVVKIASIRSGIPLIDRAERIGSLARILVNCRPLRVRRSMTLWEIRLVLDSTEPVSFFKALKWNDEGLVPAIVQDAENGDVLMMAWMDEPALRDTMTTGQTHFFSRSRRSHWHKGATSGHVQHVESISIDCDGDVLLIKARQVGGACHEGYRSCFFRRVAGAGQLEIAAPPVFDAASVYGPVKR
jgi:phosphoribosyl-AMP cyclohydrolase